MKVRELIEQLKTCDQEAHVYGCGGAIIALDQLPGYYDGSYSYYEDDVLHITTEGRKVYIETIDKDSIISRYEGDMDKIREHISIHTHNPKIYEEEIWKEIEENAKIVREVRQESMKIYVNKVLGRYALGEYARQSIEDKIGYYNCMWWSYDGDSQTENAIVDNTNSFKSLIGDRLCQGECGAIIKSGLFIPVEEEVEGKKVINWRLKS